MCQPQILHLAGEIGFPDLTVETPIEPALFVDAGDPQPG